MLEREYASCNYPVLADTTPDYKKYLVGMPLVMNTILVDMSRTCL